MRDVSSKSNSLRTAKASAELTVTARVIRAIRSGAVPKADPIGVAKIAAIQAAKNTSLMIPYCHSVPLDWVGVEILPGKTSIFITAEVKAVWKTGVEMEALTAVSAAALTLYDMLKPMDETMEVHSVKLISKQGGKSQMKGTGSGLSAAVLVLSDSVSRSTAKDTSGKYLVERLKGFGFRVAGLIVLPDEQPAIERKLKELSDQKQSDLIVTTGGTGASPRDVTVEATLNIIGRRLDGVEEAFRHYSQNRIQTAMLSRGVAGIRGKTVIVNLPGSRSAVEDGMNALFPALFHVFRMIRSHKH